MKEGDYYKDQNICERIILKWILEIPLPRDREKWRALARAVMNLQVLQIVSKLQLTDCKKGISSILLVR
jgi:hypothetical protein